MRWSIIRLIWARELRDQLRDRRTIFMIAVLPVLIYPVAGLGVLQLASGWLTQKVVIGVVGAENLPPERHPASWFACTPPPAGAPLGGIAQVAAAASLAVGPPALLDHRGGRVAFRPGYVRSREASESLQVRDLGEPVASAAVTPDLLARLDERYLDERGVDLVLVVPAGLRAGLDGDGRTDLYLVPRRKDETTRLVVLRVTGVLNRWKADLKDQRLARLGLPATVDEPIRAVEPQAPGQGGEADAEGLFGMLSRIFPFVLVMWSLAGALYPAVDLCAGEKERGTMETLLISPVSREEIVWGKFLTIWVFSAATALLNLASMALTTWKFSAAAAGPPVSPLAVVWSVVLVLPLAAFFSAVCLAVGAYARSTKEGQYYLMPLFLVTMPLIFLTLAPGVELNPFYSMVPVTGVALLLQRLTSEGEHGAWAYFVPVLAPMVVYSWLALRWAIAQFQREEVLFREAERLDLGLWLRRLWREKEEMPTLGEAAFCFGLIFGLHWLAFGAAGRLPVLALTGVAQLAFVATPALIMAVVLTTQPARGLGLRAPPWWAWPAAAALAVSVLSPLGELTLLILDRFPDIRGQLQQGHPLTLALQEAAGGGRAAWPFVLVLAVIPAVCEELAFRGFILSGLRRGLPARSAVLLSAFLFALYQMNVFQFLPHFVLGTILGALVVRTGSVIPAVVFHLVYNTCLIAPAVMPAVPSPASASGLGRLALALECSLLAAWCLYVVWRHGPAARGGEAA